MRTLALFLVLAGCGPTIDETRCTRATLESDLRTTGALSGKGVDPGTGALKAGHYVISSTYLKLATSPAGQKAFREVMEGIASSIDTQPGLEASLLTTSAECLSARTLSVWKDEASMYAFVGSPAHVRAMTRAQEMSRGGGGVTHWAGTESDATLEVGAQKLGAKPGGGF